MKELVIKGIKAELSVTITTVQEVTMGVICALIYQGFTEIEITYKA
jgi:hypothetical protein